MSGDAPSPEGQDGDRTRIVVELMRGSDPIRGSVAEVGFTGWMELIDALEHARTVSTPAARWGGGETGG